MSILTTVPESEATGEIADFYAEDLEEQSFVASHTKVLALNLPAVRAWEQLIGAITARMDERRYRLVTIAAARGVASKHCTLAHGGKALTLFSEDELIAIVTDPQSAGLTPAEAEMMAFAERVSRDAAGMTDADSQRLRDHGFDDAAILDIALAAAARNFYSRTIQALAIDVDPTPDLSPRLRTALLAGL